MKRGYQTEPSILIKFGHGAKLDFKSVQVVSKQENGPLGPVAVTC